VVRGRKMVAVGEVGDHPRMALEEGAEVRRRLVVKVEGEVQRLMSVVKVVEGEVQTLKVVEERLGHLAVVREERCFELEAEVVGEKRHYRDRGLWVVMAAEVQRWLYLDLAEVVELVLGLEVEVELKICVRQ
jgi:hypothetical protein